MTATGRSIQVSGPNDSVQRSQLLISSAPASGGVMAEAVGTRQGSPLTRRLRRPGENPTPPPAPQEP
jgi:hypothetical protein